MITRIGRRGAVLAVLGVIWIIQGVGVGHDDEHDRLMTI